MQQQAPLLKMLHGQGVGKKALAARSRLIKKVALFLIVITISALFCVWSRVRMVQMGYEISSFREKAEETGKEVNRLSVEVERLKSQDRLLRVATEALGMHLPSGEETIFVKKAEGE